MAGEKKVRVTFLEDDSSSSSGATFEAGKTYPLREDSAQHFINRGKAVREEEGKASKSKKANDDDDQTARKSGAGSDDRSDGSAGGSGDAKKASSSKPGS